ncbi:MAG: bifunctional phosphoglucose/phosphomannose isomerase [Actinobacteria bacterium]|nr:bifunctional phosphoglucose/phosphomannose isomerase [Actinomycetota bacterium]
MIDLDDVETMEQLDSLSILDDVEAFPQQCRKAWRIAETAEALPSGAGVDSVLVIGMGGSGISGDLVQAVLEPHFPVPWRVVKAYGPLPDWVGRNTCVFVMSYSGQTEEALAAFEDASERRSRMVIISSGGALASMAGDRGAALVRIPGGLQPRASLGYLCLCLLGTLQRMDLATDMAADVAEAMAVLDGIVAGCGLHIPTVENPAKMLAGRLYGKIPVIYGGYGVGAVAAQRFKTDLNEYGKTPAFYNVLPELNHNEIAGWNRLEELTSANVVVVLLRDPHEDARVALRFPATAKLIAGHVSDVIEVYAQGTSPLARLLSFALITQLAAVYLGFGYGVDPGPVEAIEKLKSELENN